MKTILTILLFTSLSTQAQWWKPTQDEGIATVFMIASGVAKGYQEAVNYNGYGKGQPFWDIETSWIRKYKNYPTDTRARFPGSKTVFVIFTDAKHLTTFVNNTGLIVGTAFNMADFRREWKEYYGWQRVGFIARKMAPYLIRSWVFEKTYKNLK